MFNSTNVDLMSLPMCNNPKFAIFSDFDETYHPNSQERYPISGIKDLESFLPELIKEIPFIFGWVSGANLQSILKKSTNYITLLPHFISSSLGTELYFCKQGVINPDLDWRANLLKSDFTLANISNLVAELEEKHGIKLLYQPDRSQGEFKGSYYYPSNPNNEEVHFNLIKQLANACNASVKISKCNPKSGDPERYFDVNFIPNNCGKDEVVKYIMQKYKIEQKNTVAFGDSCNDLEMLRTVANGFLVGNAEISAKSIYQPILRENYCFAIISGLKQIITLVP